MKRSFWIVPKALRPSLPADLGERGLAFLVDPATIARWPEEVTADDNWIVDSGYPRVELGPGVLVVELSIKKEYKAPTSAPRAANTSPTAVVLPQTRSEPLSKPMAPFSKATRCLKREGSDSSAASEEHHAEALARAMKEQIDNRRYLSLDKCCPDSVVFQLKSWMQHLKNLRVAEPSKPMEAFIGSLVPHNALYLRFVITRLFQEDAWEFIPPLAVILQQIIDSFPGLMPKYGLTLVEIATNQKVEDVLVLESVSGLSLTERSVLFGSPLYRSFVKHRTKERYHSFLEDPKPLQEKDRPTVEHLLATVEGDKDRAALEFARVYMSLDVPARLNWVCEDSNRLVLL